MDRTLACVVDRSRSLLFSVLATTFQPIELASSKLLVRPFACGLKTHPCLEYVDIVLSESRAARACKVSKSPPVVESLRPYTANSYRRRVARPSTRFGQLPCARGLLRADAKNDRSFCAHGELGRRPRFRVRSLSGPKSNPARLEISHATLLQKRSRAVENLSITLVFPERKRSS